jgi:hypothetical protein
MVKTKIMPKTGRRTIKHRGKVFTGKTAVLGKEFNLSGPLPAEVGLAGEILEINEPRPGTTRYPVSRELFSQLKEASVAAEGLVKKESTITRDEAEAKLEIANAAPGTEMAASAFAPFAAPAATYPMPSTNFAAITSTRWIPPDCTMAVGPDHVLVSVNSSVAIHQKNGSVVLAPRTLTSWFSNVIQDATIFDPKALYDQHANRWVLLAVAVNKEIKGSWFLLSVSQSSDPLKGWSNYAMDATMDGSTKTNNWVDYPSLGVDSQALYLTGNMFLFDGDFQYAKIRIVPKANIYQGQAATFKDLVRLKNANSSMSFTVQPCHTFGAPQAQYFINSYFPETTSPEDKLSLWTLTDPLGSPTLTLRTIDTDPYNLPPDPIQQGGVVALESGDIRVLNAVFRGGSIWCAFNTQHQWGDNTNVAAIHWFQIEAATGTLIQQGIYGAQGYFYMYPAVMPDNNGNMVMVFSRGGPTEFASIYFTGRRAADSLGQLQSSSLLLAGTAYYEKLDTKGKNRWGDYAGIASDPANSGLIWFYSMSAVAGNLWNTWVGSAF